MKNMKRMISRTKQDMRKGRLEENVEVMQKVAFEKGKMEGMDVKRSS